MLLQLTPLPLLSQNSAIKKHTVSHSFLLLREVVRIIRKMLQCIWSNIFVKLFLASKQKKIPSENLSF